jgi:glycosyltransferase involved in cell wall biosynthesis
LKLLLVGGARREEYMEELRALGGERLIHVGFQPHERMPEFLAVADAVALPSRRSRHAEAQVPGKVFEAMAMAKPVIATRTSDLPEILEGCGWLVEPNNVDDLTERLSYLCENLDEARGLGERARQRCIEDYSVDAVDRMLQGVLAPFQ